MAADIWYLSRVQKFIMVVVWMKRTLTVYNFVTEEIREVRYVTGADKQAVFAAKFDMMCRTVDPWIVVDSADMEAIEPEFCFG